MDMRIELINPCDILNIEPISWFSKSNLIYILMLSISSEYLDMCFLIISIDKMERIAISIRESTGGRRVKDECFMIN